MTHVRLRTKRLSTVVRCLIAGLGAESGQTMAEYGILLGVIALVVVVVAVTLGSSISALFTSVSHHV
jgi:Flp pilus assembly pilin Flp